MYGKVCVCPGSHHYGHFDEKSREVPLKIHKMERFASLPFFVFVENVNVQHAGAKYLGNYNLRWHGYFISGDILPPNAIEFCHGGGLTTSD